MAPSPASRRPGPRRARWALTVAAGLAVAVLATSCGTSGRELRDPAPGATAPPRRSSTTTTTTAPLTPIGLSIVSPAWAPGEPIPTTYSCDGAGESPPITVGGSPGAAELVVIATDPDAAGRVHWVVAGIDPSGAQIPADATPPGAVTGRNTAGDAAWEPLCPPTGETHTYEFTLYALAEPSGIGESTSAEEALGVVGAESTSAAVLTGTYRRRG